MMFEWLFGQACRPMLPAAIAMNDAIKARDPALWGQIKHSPPSKAWSKICEAYGLKRIEGQTVTGAARMVLKHYGEPR